MIAAGFLAELGQTLAPVNAALNATSAMFLFAGFRFIHQGRIEAHRRCMTGAVTASAIFLVCYLTRVALTGTHSFDGPPLARTVYLTILLTHMVLAVVVVPLVLRLLYLARKERFQEHKKLARWTFPIWAYVSITGLIVYLLLYHVYGYK